MTPEYSDDQQAVNEGQLLDLELENRSLETDLMLHGGGAIHKAENIDPFLENLFLKNVLAFEELDKEPKRSMRSLFPDEYEFPPASALSADALAEKLSEIAGILDHNGIALGFCEAVPEALVYRYMVEEVIPHEEVFPQNGEGFTTTLDGCTGGCDECFQKPYCETGSDPHHS